MAKRDHLCSTDWANENGVYCIIRAESPEEIQDKYPSVRIVAIDDLASDSRAVRIPAAMRADVDDVPRGFFAAVLAEHRGWRQYYVELQSTSRQTERWRVYAPSFGAIEGVLPDEAYVAPMSVAGARAYEVEAILLEELQALWSGQ